ncbi:MAG: hypothetical protein K2V38_04015, partial [Gemmataceae bacterium]|nr:hypothetical protein [Gemmataceae bacterium]
MLPLRLVVVVCCAVAGASTARADEKTFAFPFKEAKWDDVFAWYTKISGLGGDVLAEPKGTFKCAGLADREFTLGEVTDLINEGLMQQKLLLIRNRKSLAVVRTDQKIDTKLVPTVAFDELANRGKTELVETIVTLDEDLDAEESVDELK